MMILLITAVMSSQSGGPSGTSLGPSSVYLPMKHTSCGYHCITHRPALKPSGLNLKYRLGMSCSKRQSVNYLAYQLPGKPRHVVRSGNTGQRKYGVIKRINVFSTAELGQICRKKLGGNLASMSSHKARRQMVRTSAKKYLRVYGRCTGSPKMKSRRSSVKISLMCGDRNH